MIVVMTGTQKTMIEIWKDIPKFEGYYLIRMIYLDKGEMRENRRYLYSQKNYRNY
jgi:hypothetical protein